MLNKHIRFNFAFFIVCALQLFFEINPAPIILVLGDFHYAIKPLIVIFLLAYLINHGGLKGRFKNRIAAGLVFGLIGDTLLMFTGVDDSFFLLGLSAFLVGHFFYISAFFVDYRSSYKSEYYFLMTTFIIVSFIFLASSYILFPFLGDLEIPVLLYAFVISAMVVMAASRYGKVNNLSFYFIFIGSILFLASDAILAYNKFVDQFTYSGFVIMATYMAAQYLITIGTIERKMKKSIKTAKRDEVES